MKIRKGFVTNSSSSSFVLAIKSGDINDIKNELLRNIPLAEIEKFVSNPWVEADGVDELLNDVAMHIKKVCMNYGITIGDYMVCSAVYDGEAGDTSAFIYEYCTSIESEKLKISTGY